MPWKTPGKKNKHRTVGGKKPWDIKNVFFWSHNLEPDIYTVIPSGFWLQTTQRCW
jgi:gamma-glutamylcyclotransferase (GGCT)/AIG2-like uncharacterized protein YtfP